MRSVVNMLDYMHMLLFK